MGLTVSGANQNLHTEEQDNRYIVKKGDTMDLIAKAHGVGLQDLIKANPQIANPNLIQPGQAINLPSNSHTAIAGETSAPSGTQTSSVSSQPRRFDPPAQNSVQVDLVRQSITGGLDQTGTQKSPGETVSELQTKLNNAGYSTGPIDGRFGPVTRSALKAFQRDHNLPDTGLYDDATRTALDQAQQTQVRQDLFATPPGRFNAPFANDRATREQQAAQILKSNNVTPVEGQFYVIQIDQDSPPGSAPASQRDNWLQSYTGQTSVFKCQNGRLVEVSPHTYRSASHPNMTESTTIGGTVGYQDVDHDGIADIAHMRTGVYKYTKTGDRFSPVGGVNLPVARDTNHNGVIDPNEAQHTYYASGMQIHAGEDDHPHSAGCQTLPPGDYASLQRDLSRNRYRNFTYILVRRPNDLTGPNPF